MKFLKYLFATSLLSVALCALWSCDDDEGQKLSEAVLASAPSLNFEATGTAGQLITVYADENWIAEYPEWVTVTPDSGHRTMDVTISVSENMRDGAEDNPRKAAVVFKGRTLASRAEVIIYQNGDKFRDVKEYTLGEVVALADETVVSVPQVIVAATTTKGFIATDEQRTGTVYIYTDSPVKVGDKVSIKGTKSTDTQSLALIDCDILETLSSGGTVTYPQPKDITATLDSYDAKVREYIEVSGVLKGSNIAVEGAEFSVNVTDAPEALGLAALNGHNVTVHGYFAGLAEPVIKVIATEIVDRGVAKIIYFSEDFEWLEPWAVESGAGSSVEKNDEGATAPQIVKAIKDGVTALDALEAKGYEFLRVTTKTEGECIYLQRNYLKFGKTSYQAGIVFPKLEKVPEAGATLTLSFDWCPMRQGSGKIDPVNLIVIVANGENEVTFDIPESGWENDHKLEWINVEFALTGVEINKDTRITIRQTQWPAATANRWFLDNIELSQIGS